MADTPQILGDRIKTLEDEFFRKEDERLMQRLRELREKATSREALAQASGITSESILERLVELGVRPEVLSALSIIPLVEVAWADGSMDAKERQLILDGAEKSGIATGSPGHDLLRSWLDRKPEPKLLTAWTEMVRGLSERMTPAQSESLRAGLVERARAVARASGGLLGIGSMSPAEQDMVRQLESAFSRVSAASG